MTPPAIIRSLRAQLLVMFALLFAAAAACAIASKPLALALLAIGTLLILERAVLEPLRHFTDSARDISAGNFTRRMPSSRSRELQDLAGYVDRIAHRAMEDQAHLVRAENLASLGRLSSSLAHEIGSPLGALRGQLRVLRKQSREDALPELAHACDALDRECARIERIVRDLLDYARSRPSASTAVSLNDVLRDAIERLRSNHVLVGIHLTIDLPPEPLFVSAERHDLETALQHLFQNAVESMRNRGRLVVRLERAARFTLREPARRRDGDPAIEHPPSSRAQRWLAGNDAADIAKIIIADSGPGVPTELVDRIFDPYFTTKPAGKGAGLGLAIVARIIDSARGTVWVTKAREGGAAFHILLPVLSVRATNKPSVHSKAGSRAGVAI